MYLSRAITCYRYLYIFIFTKKLLNVTVSRIEMVLYILEPNMQKSSSRLLVVISRSITSVVRLLSDMALNGDYDALNCSRNFRCYQTSAFHTWPWVLYGPSFRHILFCLNMLKCNKLKSFCVKLWTPVSSARSQQKYNEHAYSIIQTRINIV